MDLGDKSHQLRKSSDIMELEDQEEEERICITHLKLIIDKIEKLQDKAGKF